MRYIILLTIISLLGCSGKETQSDSIVIEVTNPSDHAREQVLITVPQKKLPDTFRREAFMVKNGDQIIPSQFTEATGELMFVIDQVGPKETIAFSVKTSDEKIKYPKRTQAELSVKTGGAFKDKKYIGGVFKNVNLLRVPDEHTDHSNFIRYEGPGWESDKVAYRFYLDWRNATDVFGKKTPEVVLHNVGQENFDSYHNMQPWGMDILKVGESLGLGSLGMLREGKAIRVDKTDSVLSRVLENGVLYSGIATDYYGWQVGDQKFDIHSHLTIHTGTRLTHHKIKAEGDPDHLCTGIGKDDNAKLYQDKGSDGQWGYLATYGVQSLNNDKLGLAVLFPPDRFMEFTTDQHSHVVKLKPQNGELDYYFLAAWEKEPGGITTEEEFVRYIKATVENLAQPLEINVK